ncbi:MAG: hypothetical protein RI572_05840 [Salegentibacter sp.]|uniref:hypothetical protein n=1 Tax=Salegentibacter sp. TaxID=1903072 RepID=UPI00287034DB|nr:hypothetical protein [Salegentibacter sp.]MDR9456914.1 hypothetical protein [Salegentibacter sp.]
MKTRLLMLTGIFFMSLVTSAIAQDEKEKNSIGEAVFEEYQENGIDAALAHYEKLKKEEKENYNWDEWELNNIGYKLMLEEKDMPAAEKIFKYNMKEYPEAANPNDSYADYLIEKGETEEAKKYLKKSIEIAQKSSSEDEKTRILAGSKAKLSKLENKHRQLEFLTGEWVMEQTNYRDGNAIDVPSSTQSITYLPGDAVLRIKHTNAQNNPCCERIIAYDAMDDQFEMAYVNATTPIGIEISKLDIKNIGENKVEMMEEYIQNNEKRMARHELTRNGNDNIEWDVYLQKEDSKEWEKVNQMRFKRKA